MTIKSARTIVSSNCEIFKNHVHHNGPGTNGGEGIDAKQGSHDIRIYKNLVHHLNERIGIYADAWDTHTYNIDIFQNEVHSCGNSGFTIQTEMGGLLENINIYNNISYNNKYEGIALGSVTADPDVVETPVKHIKIINNTCYKNGSVAFPDGWGFGILIDNPDAEDIIIRNNICSQNNAQFSIQQIRSGQQVDHNLIHGNNDADGTLTGTDFIEADPLFINVNSFNFHLQSNSPAINNGNAIDAPENDFEDNNRPIGTSIDLGAYEYTEPVRLIENIVNKTALFPNPANDRIFISDKFLNENYQIFSSNGTVVQNGIIKRGQIDLSKLNTGVYFIKIQSNNFVEKLIIK